MYIIPIVISKVMGIPLTESIEVELGVIVVSLARLVDPDCIINANGDIGLIGSFYWNQMAIFGGLMRNVVPSIMSTRTNCS